MRIHNTGTVIGQKKGKSAFFKNCYSRNYYQQNKTTIKNVLYYRMPSSMGICDFCQSSIANLFVSREFIVLWNLVRRPCSKWGQLYSQIFSVFCWIIFALLIRRRYCSLMSLSQASDSSYSAKRIECSCLLDIVVCAFPSKLILLKMYVDFSSCSWRVVFSTNNFLLQWFGSWSSRIHLVQI